MYFGFSEQMAALADVSGMSPDKWAESLGPHCCMSSKSNVIIGANTLSLFYLIVIPRRLIQRADQFLPGHSSIQTTKRSFGYDKNIEIAVNDHLGL